MVRVQESRQPGVAVDVFRYRDSAAVSLAPLNSGSVFETDKVSLSVDGSAVGSLGLGHFRSLQFVQ